MGFNPSYTAYSPIAITNHPLSIIIREIKGVDNEVFSRRSWRDS
jgi:hypothetical protein